MSAIFITGTGNRFGKTLWPPRWSGTCARWAAWSTPSSRWSAATIRTHAATSDPGILLNALGRPVTEQEIDRISPWRFRARCRPTSRPSAKDAPSTSDTVIKYCQTAMDQRRDILLIEGAGGIMVPLDGERTVLDVMMALQLPLILVAGSYLGTISHTLTALDALFRRGMRVVAIVVSETEGSTVPLDDTVAAIARFAEPVIGLPRQKQDVPPQPGGKPSKTADALGRIFGQ